MGYVPKIAILRGIIWENDDEWIQRHPIFGPLVHPRAVCRKSVGLNKQILQKAIENRQNITMPDCALKPKRVMEMLKALQNADSWWMVDGWLGWLMGCDR